jgi:two-component system response regulator VanR
MVKNLLLLKEKTILFVEDDTISRNQTGELLSILFKKVLTAPDGEKGYILYEEESPDIIITDIKMPKMDGLALIKKIRRNDYETPIILLTSFVEQQLLLDAANLSIDGYLVKPVSLETLITILCQAIERIQKDMGIIPLSQELFYHSSTQKLYRNGVIVELTHKEAMLLDLLIRNRHRTLSKVEIDKRLWPLESINSSAIKKLILRIRQKIKTNIIISVRGIGYRLGIAESKNLE